MNRTIILAAVLTLAAPALAEQSAGKRTAGKLIKVASERQAPAKSANRPIYRYRSTWNASEAGVGYAFRCVFVD